MHRILVVDDDASVTSVLRRGLALEGYAVDTAGTGMQALNVAREHVPDLVILDLMMPGLDGFEVLGRLRSADANLPVLMLAARVKALLRRREMDHPEVLRFTDLALDTAMKRASRGARDIALTSTEYEVLRQFLLHPKRVLPKHMIMDRVWGYDVEGSSNVLEVYVKQLRHKLEAGGEPRLIHTFRGAGYILRES
jgi:DNA-binding response OmpR family regulator